MMRAAFGQDPGYIWVSRQRGGFGYNLQYSLWQLAIYDRQTGRLFTQTDMYGSAMRPVLSSDGKWLVYATRYDTETGLRLRNLASGSEVARLLHRRTHDPTPSTPSHPMPASVFNKKQTRNS